MTGSEPMVYVVDDDLSIGKALARLLKSWNYSCEVFSSAEDFLQAVDVNEGGCLVLDIMLPGMDGLELQQELKKRGYSIPIIFITGHGDKEIETQVMNAGAHGYLNKPFDEQLLRKMIKTALSSVEKNESSNA